MCHASQRDHVAELLGLGAPAAARDRSGRTPLHWSCARGDLDIVQALVEAAADPLAEAVVHDGGETPLELAALQGHVGVVRYLVEEREVLERLPDRLRSPSYWSRLLCQAESSLPTPKLSNGALEAGYVADFPQPNSNRKHALAYLQDAVIWTRDLDDADRGILELSHAQKKSDGRSSLLSKQPVPHSQRGPLPDEAARLTLSRLRLEWSEVNSFRLNSLRLRRSAQTSLAGWVLLQNTAAFGEVPLAPEVAVKFVQALSNDYRQDNPFHNWSHAVDVHHMVWRMMLVSNAHNFLTGIDQFSLLVSAISHDVGHPGVNNQFLVETGSDLAMKYNDKSPLENMHCSLMFQIASMAGTNVFEGMKQSDFSESRRTCIDTILATDMVHHFEILKGTEMLYHMHADTMGSEADNRRFGDRDTRQKAMNLLVHAADISNPCRPWEVCQQWAHACLDEFFSQGDREKDLGIPVQMLNDRCKINRPFSQIGFLEFMIVPLQVGLVKLLPPLHELARNLQANLQSWRREWAQDAGPTEEEADKVAARVERACRSLDPVVRQGASCDDDAGVGKESIYV
jgi:hypothetical protein